MLDHHFFKTMFRFCAILSVMETQLMAPARIKPDALSAKHLFLMMQHRQDVDFDSGARGPCVLLLPLSHQNKCTPPPWPHSSTATTLLSLLPAVSVVSATRCKLLHGQRPRPGSEVQDKTDTPAASYRSHSLHSLETRRSVSGKRCINLHTCPCVPLI